MKLHQPVVGPTSNIRMQDANLISYRSPPTEVVDRHTHQIQEPEMAQQLIPPRAG